MDLLILLLPVGLKYITYDWTDQDGNAVTANDQGNLENIGAGIILL